MLIDFSSLQAIESMGSTDNLILYQRISDDKPTLFTSNNNLSLRLKTAEKMNPPYCEEMVGGEDMYLCLKLLKKEYKYLVDQNLHMYHKPRPNIKGLLVQFNNYGIYGNDAIKHLSMKYLEVFYCFNLSIEQYKLVLKIPSPIKGMIYFNFFSLHLLFSILALFSFKFVLMSLFMLAIELFKEKSMFSSNDIKSGLNLFGTKYLVNLCFYFGAIKQTFINKVIFIPPTIHKSIFSNKLKSRIYFLKKLNFKEKDSIKKIFEDKLTDPPEVSYINRNTFRVTKDKKTFVVYKFSYLLELYFIIDFLDLNKKESN